MTMKWNSRPGRRATGTPGTDKAVRHTKWIIAGGIAVVVSITAVFTLWWYGAFLPHWITWNEKEFFYEGGEVILKNRTLRVVKTDMGEAGDRHRFMKRDQSEHIWKTPADWQVQDVLVMDIDRDQQEELVLLVWKHGRAMAGIFPSGRKRMTSVWSSISSFTGCRSIRNRIMNM